MVSIEAINIADKKKLKAFIDFPHQLYKSDPNYVPELFIAQKDLLTPGKHPFHEHSSLQLFMAVQQGKLVGRIAAILNNNHNEFNKCRDGFFGFFDCINDQEVANALFSAVKDWLKGKQLDTMIGPVNPSTNEPCGMLISGFDLPAVAMMTYNQSYYPHLADAAGLQKKVDLYAYYIDTLTANDRVMQINDALMKRLANKGITIRSINLKNFKAEVDNVRKIYNSAWDKNLGFVPMTKNEFNYLAKDLKMILNPDFCMVAEHGDKMVGFALAIPDINQILIKISNGRLLPTGIFKLLFGLKKINFFRVITLGVITEYRRLGIEACFYSAFIKNGKKIKLKGGEGSWILENNEMMKKGLENMNAKVYKTYRIYEQQL